ncbi:MAG: hypothetical protein ACLQPH_08330 [Acidimicrobiales bacterium]
MTHCPVCSIPAPADWSCSEPWLCSMACFRTYWGIPEPESQQMDVSELVVGEVVAED